MTPIEALAALERIVEAREKARENPPFIVDGTRTVEFLKECLTADFAGILEAVKGLVGENRRLTGEPEPGAPSFSETLSRLSELADGDFDNVDPDDVDD